MTWRISAVLLVALPLLAQRGPEKSAVAPDIDAVDTNGKRQTFDSLKGPKGLLLLFVRSADW